MKKLIVSLSFPAILMTILMFCLVGCDDSNAKPCAWPDGIIPYVISDEFTNSEKERIIESMNEWENSTGSIYFVEKKDEDYFLLINKGKLVLSASTIGFNGKRDNYIILSGTSNDIILHELGHVIGLIHEHQRIERDAHIRILYENIDDFYIHEFDVIKKYLYVNSQIQYDHKSIMHYTQFMFANGPNKSFESIDEFSGLFGGAGITDLDIEKVKFIYDNI